MKIFLLGFLLLMSAPSFATTEDKPEEKTLMEVLPYGSYQLAYSEIGDRTNRSLSQGPVVGARFRLTRSNLFFAPDFQLGLVLGLDPTPLELLGLGFIFGGKFHDPDFDLYLGVMIRRFVYVLDGCWTARAGAAWELSGDGTQIYAEGQMGKYKMPFSGDTQVHTYLGLEVGVQIPFEIY